MSRILYIGGFCMPDGNAAAQRVLGVAKILSLSGYEIRFSGLSRNNISPITGIIDGFSYINYPYPTSLIDWYKYLIGRDSSIYEIREYKPQIVILYNHPAFAIEHITKFCHKNGIKVVADVTEWYEPNGSPIFKLIKGYDTKRRMTKSHKTLDGLICISNYLIDYYGKSGVPVLNLPPVVDIRQKKWHQSTTKIKDSVKIVYAGSPGASKDRLDLIVKALNEIVYTISNKVYFDIIGITEKQYNNTWNDFTKYPFISFHGRISHNEVIRHLLEADFQIFIRPDTLPNRAGFPTKFVETVTSKTIPVTNLSSNLADYLLDGLNGFIIPSLEINTIKETLLKALNLTNSERIKIKNSINENAFDFKNFIEPCKFFLSSI